MRAKTLATTTAIAIAVVTGGLRLTNVGAAIVFQDGFEGRTPGTALSAAPPPIGDHYDAGPTARDATTNPPGAAATGTIFASAGPSLNRWWITAGDQTAITGKQVHFSVNFYLVQDLVNFNKAIDFNTFTDGSFSGRAFDIIIHSNGSVEYYDGAFHSVAGAGSVPMNAWFNATVQTDYSAGTYAANIGGVVFTAPFSGGAGHATNFRTIVAAPNLGQDSQRAVFFYDDILVIPEPTAGGLLLLLGAASSARRRRS